MVFYITLLLIAGIAMLFMELFVPGGIIGFIGAALLGIAVYLSFSSYGTHTGVSVLLLCFVITLCVFYCWFKFVPHTPIGRQIILGAEVSKKSGYHSDSVSEANLAGREGLAESDLRPAGIAMIDGKRYDVVTDGEFLEPNTRIRVLKVDGNRIMVEKL